MVEHPAREDAVELAVAERQLLGVADPGVEPERARKLDHALGKVDRRDVRPELRRPTGA